MYNKPQGITLFSVVIIEKNGGLFNLLTKYFYVIDSLNVMTQITWDVALSAANI